MSRQFAPFPIPTDPNRPGGGYDGITPADRSAQQVLADCGIIPLRDAALSVGRPLLQIQRACALGFCKATFMPDSDGRPPLTGKFILRAADWSDYVAGGLRGVRPPATIGSDGWFYEAKFYEAQTFFQETLPKAAELDIPAPAAIIAQVDRGLLGPLNDRPKPVQFAGSSGVKAALNKQLDQGTAGAIYLGVEIRNALKSLLVNNRAAEAIGIDAPPPASGLEWLYGAPGRPGKVFDAMVDYLKSAIAFTLKKMIVLPTPAKFGEVKTFDVIAQTATVVFNRTFGQIFEMIDMAELKRLTF